MPTLPTATRTEARAGRYADHRPAVLQRLFKSRAPTVLSVGPLGTGKAQPLDSTVWTPTGSIRMGDVKPGDLVLTPDGRTAPVLSIHPQGMQPVYRVTLNTGEQVEATGDHLWKVHYRGGGKRNGQKVRVMSAVLTTDQIASRLTVGKSKPQFRYWLPPIAPARFDSRPVPVPAYTLGVLLGDGSTNTNSVQITSADPDVFAFVTADMPAGYAVEDRGTITRNLTSSRSMTRGRKPAKRGYVSRQGTAWMARVRQPGGSAKYLGRFATSAAAQQSIDEYRGPTHGDRELPHGLLHELREMKVAGCRSWNKFVPDIYKVNDAETRLAVLQGLMDTDGTVDRTTGMPSFTSTSERLALDVQWLVRSLGGACTITSRVPKCNGVSSRTAYTCWIRFDNSPTLFRLDRKRILAKPRTKYPVRRFVVSVERIDDKPCQCIAIDHPDHLYLTDHFVPTHNTLANLEKVRACLEKYPGCRWLLIRSVRKWMTNSVLVTWEDKVIEPRLLVRDRVQRNSRSEYRLRNGSVLVVAGLDDPVAVRSSDYDGAFLLEATEVSREAVEEVQGRLRNGMMPYQQLLMDCNPGPPTHWLKQEIDHWEGEAAAGRPVKFEHIPSTHKDNPFLFNEQTQSWTKVGQDYVFNRLSNLTGSRALRLRDGRWVQSDGVVYDEWSTTLHLIDQRPIPHEWPRYWSIDFGYTNPFVGSWYAVDPDGRVYLYRERYLSGVLVEDHAKEMLRMTTEANEPMPREIIGDHDAEGRATFEKYVGQPITPAEKDVDAGIQDVKSRLKVAGDGLPRLFIMRGARCHEPDEKCAAAFAPTSTEQEMDSYIWDPKAKKGERPLKKDDHGNDALRYICRHLRDRGPLPSGAESHATGKPTAGRLPAGLFRKR